MTQSKLYLSTEESREDFERDAFGSATFQHSWPAFTGPSSGPGTAFDNSYNTNAGGSMNSETQTWDYPYHSSEPTGWDSLEGWTSYGYDGRGNLTTRMHTRYEPEWIGTMDPYDEVRRAATHYHHAISYYTADERLRVHQITRDSTYHDESSGQDVEGDSWGAYEEYWYDALGRRVLKRSRQNSPICTDTDRCQSSIERFVWDGDQILWELRTSSGSVDTKDPTGSGYTGQSGSIGYVHAGDIDKPLGMMRNGHPIVLHHNWRGMVEAATDTSGTQVSTDVPWPGGRWKSTGQFLDPREVHTWVGSLPMGQADHSGLQYRRNRYYNPESGQFTQQDPIGIAGGLNLYGYADGDPINFSDPFGLKPRCEPFCSAVDLGFLLADIQDIRKNGLNWSNGLGVGLGVLSASIPFVTGLGGADELARGASEYVDITRKSRGKARFWNRATDVGPTEFADNLMDAGFTRSTPEEGVQVFTKGDRKYNLRHPDRSNSNLWTADVFIQEEQVGKIRLGVD